MTRLERIQGIVGELARKQAAGEGLDLAGVVAANGDLAPELEEALRVRFGGGAGEEAQAAKPQAAGEGKPPETSIASSLIFSAVSATGHREATEDASKSVEPPLPAIEGLEILQQVGRGGGGVVYKARQLAAGGRLVAVKLLLGEQHASPAQMRRFSREVEIASELHHPHIAEIYDSGLTRGRHYFVMQYIEGKPLDDFCKQAALSIEVRLRLFVKVCAAMAFAHQRGVIHRDLKPSNILVDAQGEPHILDFGLAKVLNEAPEISATLVTGVGAVLGTLPYMAPEQTVGGSGRSGGGVDTRTDVYALGVMLYQVLTGEFPYPVTGTMAQVLENIVNAPPRPPSAVNRAVGGELETIVLRALAKEPDRRYASAGDLGRDIGHLLAGEPIEARRASAMYQLRKLAYRHRRVVAPLAAALAVVVAIAVVSYVQVREDRNTAVAAQLSEADARHRAEAAARTAALARTAEAAALVKVEASRDALDREVYRMRVALADRAVAVGNFGQAGRLLEDCPQRLRGWEWHRLERLTHQDLSTWVPKIGGGIFRLVYSPDGKRIAAACSNRGITIADTATGEELAVLKANGHNLFGVAFSPDSTKVVSSADDKVVRVWDAKTGEQLRSWASPPGKIPVTGGVMFSPDGWRILVACGPLLRVYDATSANDAAPLAEYVPPAGVNLPLPNPYFNAAITCSPDGRYIPVSNRFGEAFFYLWDYEKSEIHQMLTGHAGWAGCVAFSSNGGRLASWGGSDNTVAVWDLGSGKVIASLAGCTDGPSGLAFSPDGTQLVAAGSEGFIRVWDIASGEQTHIFAGHSGTVTSVDFSRDGKRIVSGDSHGNIKFWDANAKPIDLTIHTPDRFLLGMAMMPDGGHCVTAGADTRLLDLARGEIVQASERARGPNRFMVLSVALSARGDMAAVGHGNDIDIRDPASNATIAVLHTHDGGFKNQAFSPDGRRLAAIGNGTIHLWDVDRPDGPRIWKTRAGSIICALAFTPDGRWLLSTGDLPELNIWDPATGKLERSITWAAGTPPAVSMAFSPDGKTVALGLWKGAIAWYDFASGRFLDTTGEVHTSAVESLAYSPDGRRMVSGSWDRDIKIWDVETRREMLTLQGHARRVHAVAFTPDGRKVVSAGEDATVRVWDGGAEAATTQPGAAAQVGQTAGPLEWRTCWGPRG